MEDGHRDERERDRQRHTKRTLTSEYLFLSKELVKKDM